MRAVSNRYIADTRRARRAHGRGVLIAGALAGALASAAWVPGAAAQTIGVDPGLVDFGQEDLTETANGSFTIDNLDDGPPPSELEVTAIALAAQAGDDCDVFTVSPPELPISLLGDDPPADIPVSFTPATRDLVTCTVAITSNDPDAPVTNVTLQGTGQGPRLTVDPAAIDFGGVRLADGADTQTFTITNAGNESYTMLAGDVTISGDGSFALVGWPPDPLPALNPDDTVDVTVSFDPSAIGDFSATVTVTATGDTAPETAEVALTGAGIASEIAVSGASDFGNIVVGNAVERTFTIENQGDADLRLDTVALQNQSPAGQYAFVGSPPAPGTILPPGDSVDVTVRCTPETIGLKTANLFIDSDADIGDDPTVIGLTCRGQQPDISVNPLELGFGERLIGERSANQNINITNAGGENVSLLTISRIRLSAGNTGDFDFSPTSGAVNPGDTLPVSVSFTPTAAGPRSATLTIESDDPDQPVINVALTGTGRENPDISVSETSLTFPAQNVGSTSVPLSFNIANASGTFRNDLQVGSITVTGTHAGDFGVNPTSTTVPSGQAQSIDVTFTPGDSGERVAQIRIQSNDPDESEVLIDLSGTGVAPNIVVNPASIDFGIVGISQTSPPRVVVARNTGTANLEIAGVRIDGVTPGDFAFDGPTNITLAPGEEASWNVSCAPTATGVRQADFHIPSNDSTPPLPVVLTCTGVEAELQLVGNLAFPPTYVQETSAPRTVQLLNAGAAAVTISSITVTNSVFRIIDAPATSFTLEVDEQVPITVEFTPAASVSYAADLRVETDLNPASFPVTGQGVVAEMSVIPGSTDFGTLRVGQSSQPRVFTLANVASAPFRILDISIDDAENFTMVAPALPDGGLELLPNAGDASSTSLQVTATPAVMGLITGRITVTTDIPGAGPATIDLTVTGIAPDMSVSRNRLDFGGVDIQAGVTPQQTITITNTGTLDLAIGSIAIEGSQAEAYALADGQAVTAVVPVGESFDVTVVYQPALERMDDALLVITSNALSDTRIEIPLSGRGIDRHIEVSALELSFPATYRHPIEPARIPLEIRNTGEATLAISMLMTQGLAASAFAIEGAGGDTALAQVAPGGTETITVTFTPTAASAAPYRASLLIINDDDDRPMVEVTMTGVGLAPGLFMAPGGGVTLTSGVGVPVRVSDVSGRDYGIRLVNQDETSFTVAAICAVAAGAAPGGPDDCATQAGPFRILGFSPGAEVAAGSSLDFDVEFRPGDTGSHEVVIEVYLEGDPEPVAFTVVRGRAVEVSLHGGGCHAGPGRGNSPWWACALLIALVLVTRRRRAAPALRAGARGSRAGVWLAVVAGLLLAERAHADAELDLSTFRPVPAVEAELLSVEGPEVGAASAWALGLALHHAVNPLELETARMRAAPVAARTAAELGFSYAFLERYEAGLVLPLLQQSGDQVPAYSGIVPADGTALGDLTVRGKASIWRGAGVGLAGAAELTLPTATDSAFAGAGRIGGHARGIAGFHTRRLRGAVNVGVRLRAASQLADVEQGSELTYGVAGSYRLLDQLAGVAEVFGAHGFGDGPVSPLEAVLGVRYRPTRQLALAGGVGRGLVSGVGAPDFRAFLMVSFSPAAREVTPVIPPQLELPGDADGDGVPDADDRCPDEPEDHDGFEDHDGCLDPDNDGDGRIDRTDECPDEPEDYDGFQDEDGCPDPDNDGDGIPDSEDQCPNEPEDNDGFQDQDGCDDPDNDRDGIPDVIDQCPTEAETINGNADDDGCPDEGESLVMLLRDRLELFSPIGFRGNTARLAPESDAVLSQVAAVLRAHPEFVRIRIGVHVAGEGRRARALSESRAAAIQQWLTERGIEPERIETAGHGGARPLLPGKGRAAREVNERVEIVIVKTRSR